MTDPVSRAPGPDEQAGEAAAPARRPRRPRRAARPATNPASDDAPDLPPPAEYGDAEQPHDRWLREQRPPHWE